MVSVVEYKAATPDQSHDLLNFRVIGQEAYERYIFAKIISLPNTSVINRRKRLATFSTTKVQKKMIKWWNEREILANDIGNNNCHGYLNREQKILT